MDQSCTWNGESDAEAGTWEERALQAALNHGRMALFLIDGNPRHGLLVIHHAHTDEGGLLGHGMRFQTNQGVSVVEIFERQGQWRVLPRSRHDWGINFPLSGEATSARCDPATQPREPGAFLYPSRLEQQ